VPAAYQLWRGEPIGIVLVAVIVLPLLFMVRGYTVADGHLEIARLGWTTRWPLAGLRSATVDRTAMARAFRRWGNGGVYAVTGAFSTPRLGVFRAYVTDTQRTVVLQLADATLVVSPDDPEAFARAIMRAA